MKVNTNNFRKCNNLTQLIAIKEYFSDNFKYSV